MTKKPAIVTRQQWGAREAVCPVYDARDPRGLAAVYWRITVHHDASLADPKMTLEQSAQRMRDHQSYHMKTCGWCDLGYHYVIDPVGRVFSGRSLFSPGAHVGGENSGNCGICLMGAYHQQPVPAAAVFSLIGLCAWLCETFGIDPGAIYGHRDWLATECPGKHLYDVLSNVKQRVVSRLKRV